MQGLSGAMNVALRLSLSRGERALPHDPNIMISNKRADINLKRQTEISQRRPQAKPLLPEIPGL